MIKKLRPFHLAFPVYNIKKTIKWYTENFDCKIGRKDNNWVDFDFYGHQISAHKIDKKNNLSTNIIDRHHVPSRHFGIILKINQWEELEDRLRKNKINFFIKPYTRFKDEVGEQSTMFIQDPSGNFLEFKSFKNDSMIFKSKIK